MGPVDPFFPYFPKRRWISGAKRTCARAISYVSPEK